MSTFTWPPSGGGVPIYPTLSAFPAGTQAGQLAVAADTGSLFEWNGTTWVLIATPGSDVVSIGAFGSSPNAAGGTISSNTLTLEPASGSFPGGVSTTTQTFAGNKTFSGNVTSNGSFNSTISGAATGAFSFSDGSGHTYGFGFQAGSGSLLFNTDAILTYNDTHVASQVPFTIESTGSTSSPSLLIDNDFTTGWYRVSANNWGFSASGSNIFTLGTGGFLVSTTASVTNSANSTNLTVSNTNGAFTGIVQRLTTTTAASGNFDFLDGEANGVTVFTIDGTGAGSFSSVLTPLVQSAAGGPSITLGAATGSLLDSSGDITVDWQNTTLRDSNASAVSVDWTNRILIDSAGFTSVDWLQRELLRDNVTVAANWETGQLLDSNAALSVDWQDRALVDQNGQNATSWIDRTDFDTAGVSSIDWQSRNLIDSAGVVAEQWSLRSLLDNTGGISVDWNSRQLKDSAAHLSINWDTRSLVDPSTTIQLTWSTLGVTIDTLLMDGSLNVTGYQHDTPSTGNTVTIGGAVSQELLEPAGTLATLTVRLPSSPVDGHVVGISSTQAVTALTLSTTDGSTISGGISLLQAGGFARYQYYLPSTTWFRIG